MVSSEYITKSADLQITTGEVANVDIGPVIQDDGAIYVETVVIDFDDFDVKNVTSSFSSLELNLLTKTPNNIVINRETLKTSERLGNGESTTVQATNTNTSYNEYIQKGKQLFIELKKSEGNALEFNESKTVTFTMSVIGRRAI